MISLIAKEWNNKRISTKILYFLNISEEQEFMDFSYFYYIQINFYISTINGVKTIQNSYYISCARHNSSFPENEGILPFIFILLFQHLSYNIESLNLIQKGFQLLNLNSLKLRENYPSRNKNTWRIFLFWILWMFLENTSIY